MRKGAACAVQLSHRAAAALQTAVPASERVLAVHSFGDELVGYSRGLQLQQRVWELRQAGTVGDTLIQLQVLPLSLPQCYSPVLKPGQNTAVIAEC